MQVSPKVRIPILFKLVGVTVAILLTVALAITLRSSYWFEEISRQREKDMNGELASARIGIVDNLIASYVKNSTAVASQLIKTMSNPEERASVLDSEFNPSPDFVSIEIWELVDGRPFVVDRVVNKNFLSERELGEDYLEKVREQRPLAMTALFSGQTEVLNMSLPGGAPLFAIGLPLVKDEQDQITHVVVSYLRLDRIQSAFSASTTRTIYLVDKNGRVLAHPDDKLAIEARSLADNPAVAHALKSKPRAGQKNNYSDPKAGQLFAAFAKGSHDLMVIVEAPESIILAPAKLVSRKAIRITGISISIAIFIIAIFSMTLTAPIEKLLDVTREIAKGNFDIKSAIRSMDEVGALANSFDNMVEGLKERDKVKSVLNKFHGSSVANDIMTGDLQLGGSRKRVVVFFSDIRDFTKFSEGHTPEEVVEMLNEYFQIMVGIVTKYHGVVDKFVGDAMMAVWGAPNTSGNDEYNAVRACLEMRAALFELNKSRLERGLTEIRIGMGLHAGDAISGTIGSSERMEYTVIGDTVNMAARIEASTKSLGTDLLISDTLAGVCNNQFLLEGAGSVTAKGKSEPIVLHKVRGYVDSDTNPVLVQTPYSDFTPEVDEKIKVA